MKGKAVYVGHVETAAFTLLSVGETETQARAALAAQWDKVARKKALVPTVEQFSADFGSSPLVYHGATYVLVPVGGGTNIFSASVLQQATG